MPIYRTAANTYLVQHLEENDSPLNTNTAGGIFTNRFAYGWGTPSQQLVVPATLDQFQQSKSGFLYRRFEVDSLPSTINAPGGVSSLQNLTSAFTYAAIIRLDGEGAGGGLASNKSIWSVISAAFGNRFGLWVAADGTLAGAVNAGATRTCSVTVSARVWNLIVITKSAGTVIPRAHRYNFATGVWQHGDFNNNFGDVSGHANGYLGFGSSLGLGINNAIDMAMFARWPTAFDDTTTEGLITSGQTTTNWLTLFTPADVYQFAQEDSALQIIDLRGNSTALYMPPANPVAGFDYDGPVWTYNQVDYGSASVSGGGAATAVGVGSQPRFGTATVSGSGAVVATGRKVEADIGSVSGRGSVVAAARKQATGTASASGGGRPTATGVRFKGSAATVSGGGRPLAVGAKKASSVATVSGGGFGVAVGREQSGGAAAVSGGGRPLATGAKKGASAGLVSAGGRPLAVGGRRGASVATVSAGGRPVASGTRVVGGAAAVSGGGRTLAVGGKRATGVATASAGGRPLSVGRKLAAGSASATAGGRPLAVGVGRHAGTATTSGGGRPLATGRKGARSTAVVLGGGRVTVVGSSTTIIVKSGSASVSGGGRPLATGKAVLKTGSATTSGRGAVIALGVSRRSGVARLSGAGVVTGAARRLSLGAAVVSGSGQVRAVGQAGTRVGSARVSAGGRCIAVGTMLVPPGEALVSGGGEVTAHGMRTDTEEWLVKKLHPPGPKHLVAVPTASGGRLERAGATVVYDPNTGEAYWGRPD